MKASRGKTHFCQMEPKLRLKFKILIPVKEVRIGFLSEDQLRGCASQLLSRYPSVVSYIFRFLLCKSVTNRHVYQYFDSQSKFKFKSIE